MRTLSQVDFLFLWDKGRMLHPLDQALLAIHAAFPETRGESIADWPLGRRNRALAELFCACFGASFEGWTACPQCEEKLEFRVNGEALMQSSGPQADDSIQFAGISFRLPTSRDLARIADEPDPARAAACLVERCAHEGSADASAESQLTPPEWTEEFIEAVGERMAQADPLAEILLDFNCPSCGESFKESLNLPAFLWAELEGRAKRLLLDVHTLARAYGWNESEILGLSPARRDFYLAMVRA